MIRAAVLDTTLALPEGGGSELLPLFVGGTRRAGSTSGAGPGLTVIRFGRISRLTGETGTKTPSPSEAPRRTLGHNLARGARQSNSRGFALSDLANTVL